MWIFVIFFFNDTATTEIYTLSLHDALPISTRGAFKVCTVARRALMSGSSGDLDLERSRVLLRVFAVPHHAVHQLRAAHRRLRQVRLRGRRGVLVEVDAVDLLSHGEIVHVLLEQAP